MQFLGRLVSTLSGVAQALGSPHRVREVPAAEYGPGRCPLGQEGRLRLYGPGPGRSWDCVLLCPHSPQLALRYAPQKGPQRGNRPQRAPEPKMETGPKRVPGPKMAPGPKMELGPQKGARPESGCGPQKGSGP